MEQRREYVISSLELHLFFARIMKEHSLFLRVGFLPPNAGMAKEGALLFRQFEALLSRAVALSDGVVGCGVLESGEVVTEFTEMAECQTQKLTGVSIDRGLTARTRRLRCCGDGLRISSELVGRVRQLNRDALGLVNRLIALKERVLHGVKSCCLFTVNYPLLIEHILREACLYRSYLEKLEGKDCGELQSLRDGELFWNRIMMEHALFIRGLLDPCEDALIHTADDFAADYRRLLETSAAANDRMMHQDGALELTRSFRDFKTAGVQGIEGCQIRSIILPLLADHVLREANHYIRLLEERGTGNCGC